jgi:hypothetical protein
VAATINGINSLWGRLAIGLGALFATEQARLPTAAQDAILPHQVANEFTIR